MYNKNKILGIITARGGSKGVPRKNIKKLAGKPLIEWTIEAALKSCYIDKLVLSSDCDDIIAVARAAGCCIPFKRPENLSGDEASSMDVILHTLNNIEHGFTHFVLLQPTSPLRSNEHIDKMIEQFFVEGYDFMVSVTKLKKHPSFNYLINDGFLEPIIENGGIQLRRQEMIPTFEHNGAIYIADIQKFIENPNFNNDQVGAFVMDRLDSIDIDNAFDFEIAELVISKRSGEKM